MLPMRRRRTRSGAEFDGTSANYGGLAPVLNGDSNQIFGPEKNKAIEVGTKWELFDRHLLVTAALFQTDKDNAREAVNVTPPPRPRVVPYPANTAGTVPCISAGAAYRIRGIDLEVGGKITDKWSVFGGLVLMQSEVTKSLVPPPIRCLFADQCRPAARQHRPSIVQPAQQISAHRCLGARRSGGLPLEDLRRHLACRQPGHVAARASGASTRSPKPRSTRTGQVKLFVNNIFNKLYYTRCIRARRRSCWRRPAAPRPW